MTYGWRHYRVDTAAIDVSTPLVPANRYRISLSINIRLGNCPISQFDDGDVDNALFTAFQQTSNLYDYKDWGEVLREALFAVNNTSVLSLSVNEGFYLP